MDNDGEAATYSSFRPKQSLRFWSPTETKYFYKALAAVGTCVPVLTASLRLGFHRKYTNLVFVRLRLLAHVPDVS